MIFQKIVLITATVILIICLIVLAALLWASKNELVYPPEIGTCPDYFIMKQNNQNKMECYNEHKLGNISGTMWFDPTSKPTIADKRTWANTHDLDWDGITNMNSE